MGLQIGIVGLPNVGKSTLFNALLKKQLALVANYPFATIEPNVGIVAVPDERLEKLAGVIADSERDPSTSLRSAQDDNRKLPPIIPAIVNFVDIAGLVRGASEGAGLGNKFLSHIREVSIIAHVVRAFEDENIIKEGSVDPKSDYETIKSELILADLATLEKIRSRANRLKPTIEQKAADILFEGLNAGTPARDLVLPDEEEEAAKQFFLLSKKPEIVVLNVSENDYTEEKIQNLIIKYSDLLEIDAENITVICAKIEAELAALSENEQKEYLMNLGLNESGLERLIKKAYETLDLISFLTAGEKEVRAWTIKKGTNAQNAAGVIHTDFIQHFIKAEVVNFDDFVQSCGWKSSRDGGKTRFEGRNYIIKDGDVVEFKIGK